MVFELGEESYRAYEKVRRTSQSITQFAACIQVHQAGAEENQGFKLDYRIVVYCTTA